MTLPQPIVAYQKQASDHPDRFGPWCKLHHAFLTHLAEACLSGKAYKVVIQVLCASFHLGQYLHRTLSLDQFQISQRLGRKAVVEGLRQAVAKDILYEEEGWQAGTHAPKQYGLVLSRALAEDRSKEAHSAQHRGVTILKGVASFSSKCTFEPSSARPAQTRKRSSSIIELHREAEEEFRVTTGAEIEPAAGVQPSLKDASRAEERISQSLQQHELLSLSRLLADDETAVYPPSRLEKSAEA